MKLGEICEHKRLARQCGYCERDQEIARLKAELEKVVDECVKKELELVTWKQKAERHKKALESLSECRKVCNGYECECGAAIAREALAEEPKA